MKDNEIKSLHEANTIEAVTAMVERRRFNQYAKADTTSIKQHLQRLYTVRVLSGLPEAAALNHAKASVVHANGGTVKQQAEFWRAADAADDQAKETKMYTIAEDVEQAYDAAAWENCHSEGCYALAIAAAHELGGIEIANSNDGNSSISFAPTRTFEFDDSSSVQVTYGGVFVILPNQPY